jgi:DNA-binding XRE family transcriptional regulator
MCFVKEINTIRSVPIRPADSFTARSVPKKPKRKIKSWSHLVTAFDCELRTMRAKYGLTLREVARYSGVAVATVQRMECGHHCDLATAMKLARFFERPVEKIWQPRSVR